MRLFLFCCWTALIFWGPENLSANEASPNQPPAEKKWYVPKPSELRSDLDRWFDSLTLPQEVRAHAFERFPADGPIPGNVLFEAVLHALKTASPEAAAFLNASDALEWNEIPFGHKLRLPPYPNRFQSLGDASIPPRLAGALRLYLAQRLIRIHRYDEALGPLREMTPDNTIDPLAVLFCRGIAYNQLLEKTQGQRAMREFWEVSRSETVTARRFAEVAKLIENELDEIAEEDEQPSNISRQMQDVRRRLGLGDTDEPVQDLERDVLNSLDKLIEKLEQQQRDAQQQGNPGQGKPAKESRIARQKGPGNVSEKNFSDQGGWGELPPKERDEALLRIEKEFPAHYREIVEQYFRQLAGKED